MTPVMQTSTGDQGNCWAACLASLLNVPLEEVDQCAGSNPDWQAQTDKFLADRGLFYIELSKDKNGNLNTTMFPDGCLVIVGCNTKRGRSHAVIGRVRVSGMNIEIDLEHDPHPGGSEALEMEHIILLCKYDK
jgi:hypothetical protein